nr:bacterial Ig-like domain-containing protein [Lactobacillus xylocopicola]
MLGLLATGSNPQVNAKSYHKAVTKIAGSGTYAIYHHASKQGPSGKFTSTKYFKYSQIQSKQSISTSKGKFWKIIVNGRTVGWVSQDFFARNQISVAAKISLVQNPNFSFNPKDAINYVTDASGTAVNPSKVSVSTTSINSGTAGQTKVEYHYGTASASADVTVRADAKEGIASANKAPQKGPQAVPTWKGGSKSSSRNWNAAHHYTVETRANAFRSNGLTLRTKLFQPRFVSLGYHQAADSMGQVGAIPEGISIHGSNFTVALFNSSSSQKGHLVSYNLKQINKFKAQDLSNLKWSTFKKYSAHIKVSPYIKLGHGQAIGASAKYIYVIANNNTAKNSTASEEILQIRKSDMKINQVWSFRIWNGANGRYIHNATFVDDNTMYCLFHNGSNHLYEYWKVTRSGDTWTPVEVGATKTDFISNHSPVQGFTYDQKHQQFYIGFNDYIFKVAQNGTYRATHRLKVKREIEGMSVSGNKLYVEFAQRGELMAGKTK